MARRRYSNGSYPPASSPLATSGGIKAQNKRGAFGNSWWAKRWIEVLESFQIGARLSRGRTYARKGQVTDINISKGKVTAKVQGSRRTPYRVVIQVKPLSKANWKKVGKVLSERVSFAARLLAGEMPNHIGEVFEAAGLSLFPSRRDDLQTQCSCPDWSNPCKHIAAVYYLLGEAFDSDPFLIFELRGLQRKELAGLIGELPEQYEEPKLDPQPLPMDVGAFWGGGEPPAMLLEPARPAVNAAHPKRLGALPFWRGGQLFLDAVEELYVNAAAAPEEEREL